MTTGELWRLVQGYLDSTGDSERAVARRAGMTAQALNGWKHRTPRSLPHPHNLRAVAEAIDVPYQQLLTAALRDARYLPEDETWETSIPAPLEPSDPRVRRALRLITKTLVEQDTAVER